MQQLRHVRLRLDDESGMTLLEMMAALFILSLTMTALLASVVTSLRSLDVSKHRQDATQLASSTLEATRGMPFNQVALDASQPPATSTFEGQVAITDPYGLLTHEQAMPGGFTLTTWVTTVDGSTDERRVVAIVSWEARGATRSLRQETLVAEARRGLPAPAFDVHPPAASRTFWVVDDGSGTLDRVQDHVCVDHTLSNLGEQDKYDWYLSTFDGDSVTGSGTFREWDPDGVGPLPFLSGFYADVTDPIWDVWVVLDGQAMQEATGDPSGSERPDATAFVPRNAQVPLEVCYRPRAVPSPSDGPLIFEHTFRSSFDDSVQEVIEDTIFVAEKTTTELWLHHPRTGGGSVDVNAKSLLMNETMPTATDPTVNYNKNNAGGLPDSPGLLVASGSSVTWDHQYLEATTLDQEAAVELWLATAADGTLDYTLDFERWTSGGGGGTTELLATETVSITACDGGVTLSSPSAAYCAVSRPMNLPDDLASRQFAANQYLRLKFTCDNPGGTPCYVHYDVAGHYESVVTVEEVG